MGGLCNCFLTLIFANDRLVVRLSPRVLKLIRQVGIMTYPLYLIHQLVGSALIYQFFSFGFSKEVSVWVATGVIVLLTYLISVAEIVIRNPMKDILVKIPYDLLPSFLSTKSSI